MPNSKPTNFDACLATFVAFLNSEEQAYWATRATEAAAGHREALALLAPGSSDARAVEARIEAVVAGTMGLSASIQVMPGRRYVRIVKASGSGRHAFAFIDTTNGDVLKPAGWKGPAKHARGSILGEASADAYGVTLYGARYMGGR